MLWSGKDMIQAGPTNSLTDIAGLKVGNATDHRLRSGVTVVTADKPFTAAVHIMGGAPGTRETDLLSPENTVDIVHALVLSGGSAFGLDAASGVMDCLRDKGIGFSVGSQRVPIVPAAILFDLNNGGEKDWSANPYPALGRTAYQAAGQTCAIGSVGAGTGARAGNLKGGLGTASLQLSCGHIVAALVACNSLGQTTIGDGPHFWAAPFELDDEFGGLGLGKKPSLSSTFDMKKPGSAAGCNTTIGIVATDASLSKSAARRLAVAAHDGIARAVVPAHTPLDGDLLFAASTGDGIVADINTQMALGHAASICVSRAIARGIFAAESAPDDTVAAWRRRFSDAR